MKKVIAALLFCLPFAALAADNPASRGFFSAAIVTDSGTYFPTVSGQYDVVSYTVMPFQWMRVGNVVTVSGVILVKAEDEGRFGLQVSLPIPSDTWPGVGSACTGSGYYDHPAGIGSVMVMGWDGRANVNAMSAGPAADEYRLGLHFTYVVQ